jgi:hypothetical protein
MPKTSSPDLFLLISELSKNEKGYIKKTAFRQTEDALFIKLFNAIESQKVYDEKKLLISEKYIRQLPRLKNYLYEKILTSLESYHSKNDKDIKLRQILNRAQILFAGFYDQCRKLLPKAKDIASKAERFSHLLEILEWERTLTIEKLMVNDLKELALEEKKLLDKMKNLAKYKAAYDKVSTLYTKTILIRNSEEHEHFKKIIAENSLEDESNAQSLTARILLLKTKCKYLSALDDKKEYLKYARMAVALMEENKEYTNQNLLQYIKVLNNLVVTLSENKKFDEFKEAVNKLKSIPENYSSGNNKKMRSIVFMRAVIREFYHYHGNGNYKKANELIPTIEEGIHKYKTLISNAHLVMFYYAIAYSYFIMEDFKRSLVWINKIINTKVSDETMAFHSYARILNIAVHFELRHDDLLDYLVRSTKRFLNKQDKLYEFENIFISFLQQNISSLMNHQLHENIFKHLLNQFLNVKDPKEHLILEYFDFLSWAKTKILIRSYKDVLEMKTKNNIK